MPATCRHETPRSRHELSPLVDLSAKDTRVSLSPGAVKAFVNLIEKWKVKDTDAMALLGDMGSSSFYALKKSAAKTVLSQDRLTRISYLVGIFKALNILYGVDLADAWLQLPNKNRIFQDSTPLAYMIRGGLPAFQVVRQLLDSRRGGV